MTYGSASGSLYNQLPLSIEVENYSGLYDLGTAVSGSQWIGELSGEITISA